MCETSAFMEVMRTSRDVIRMDFYNKVHLFYHRFGERYVCKDPVGLYKLGELQPTTVEGRLYIQGDSQKEVGWDLSGIEEGVESDILDLETGQVVIPEELLRYRESIFKKTPITPVYATHLLVACVKMMIKEANRYKELLPGWYGEYPFGYLTEEGVRYFSEEDDIDNHFEEILGPIYDFIMKDPDYIYRVEVAAPSITVVKTIDVRAYAYELHASEVF